jgi:hypothetical protein
MPLRALLNKLIRIFEIELEDLEDDINDLLEILERRKDSQEITNYVYMGNKGVLLNQIAGVKELLEKIRSIDAHQYKNVDVMIADIKKMLDERLKAGAFPEVVHHLVERKFEKVCTYVIGTDKSQ